MDGKMNPKLKPYADWMEGFLKGLVAHQPKRIGVICLLDDGRCLTSYYGDVCPADKGMMAYHMISDGVLDEVYANAAGIVKAAEKMEGQ